MIGGLRSIGDWHALPVPIGWSATRCFPDELCTVGKAMPATAFGMGTGN